MDIIYIKKQRQADNPEGFVYVVSAVGIQTPEGMKPIPHPYGKEAATYATVEQAVEAVHRAGYAADFEGQAFLLPAPSTGLKAARPAKRSGAYGNLERELAHALPALREQLKDTSPVVIAQAAWALGEFQDTQAIPALVQALSHDDATVRKQAGEALAKLGEAGLRALKMALKDKNWVVRHSAVVAFVEMLSNYSTEATNSLAELLPLLKDDNWLVRSQVALFCGQIAKRLREQADK